MKILHLASFSGNLGDVYSNAGVSAYFDTRNISSVYRIEIRRIYQNYNSPDKISFNDVLRMMIGGSFDCLFIGGGGFLDYWLPQTSTGTTFDFDYELMNKVDKPIIFSSLGAFPHKAVPVENYLKFTQFMEYLSRNEYVSLMFRNDGSLKSINEQFPDLDCSNFMYGGDHAFLYAAQEVKLGTNRRRYICVNVGSDQLCLNSAFRTGVVDKDEYFKNFARILVELSEKHDCEIVFIPHLYSDNEAVGLICRYLPDIFIRNYFSVAEYDPLGRNLDSIIALYRESVFNICGRLHSNIMSICTGSLTISLAILDRVGALADQFENALPVSDIENCLSVDVDALAAEKADLIKVEEVRSRIVEFLDLSFGHSSHNSCRLRTLPSHF